MTEADEDESGELELFDPVEDGEESATLTEYDLVSTPKSPSRVRGPSTRRHPG